MCLPVRRAPVWWRSPGGVLPCIPGRISGEGLCAIGIRAHYFDEAITDNAFPVVIEELIEEPFAWIIKFRYEKQDSKSTPVWWRFSKEKKNPDGLQRTRLGIAPEDILLLYK